MANILHIETAGSTAYVMIAREAAILSIIKNEIQTQHAAFLHPAVQNVLANANMSLDDIDAIAVANGPGSYTGLRVGLAAAKGICYALNKPLICINNLQIMAVASVQPSLASLYAPMIDARRMEVFTGLYTERGEMVLAPHAKILNENSFAGELDLQKIMFCGNGADKWKKICSHPNALFSIEYDEATSFASLAHESFMTNALANLAYVEPFYLKEFYLGNS